MTGPVERAAYGVAQRLRRTWYLGHYALARRVSSMPGASRPGAGLVRALETERRALFATDWANIAAGRYAMPFDLLPDPVAIARASRGFVADLPRVGARRRHRLHDEVARDPGFAGYPSYYRRNFHYQTDGYLSARSAALYDFQVEVLFVGAADAMRRQALVPVGEALARRGQGRARLLDIGCGTGRLLAFVKDNWPRLETVGVDLSPFYLAVAGERLRPWRRSALVQGLAERLPLPDASVDVVTMVFLLHELPPRIRARVAGEIARVLRPGGRLVVVDSLQRGDRPALDPLLDGFPDAFHEPYYASYLATDLARLFAAVGLIRVSDAVHFLSRTVVFDRPG